MDCFRLFNMLPVMHQGLKPGSWNFHKKLPKTNTLKTQNSFETASLQCMSSKVRKFDKEVEVEVGRGEYYIGRFCTYFLHEPSTKDDKAEPMCDRLSNNLICHTSKHSVWLILAAKICCIPNLAAFWCFFFLQKLC